MATMLDTIRQVIAQGPLGNRWHKVNLHVHGLGNRPEEVVRQAREAQIDLIAITDHQTFDYCDMISAAANEPGRPLVVLPGIEITALEGVHLLAIFPPGYSAYQRTQLMGWLEVNPPSGTGAASRRKVAEIFRKVEEGRGIIVIPHPYTDGIGLLDSARKISTKLEWLESGYVRLIQISEDKVKYIGHDEATGNWTNRYVLASATPEQVRSSSYSLAPLNRSDAHNAQEVTEGCSWFRMERPTLGGLTQVACEPRTRIGRDAPTEPSHDCILHMRVFGGYCDGQVFSFNDGLNCIVGQNYAGKSAVFDFIRFALAHEDVIPKDSRDRLLLRLNGILGSGGAVELYLRRQGSFYAVRRVFRPELSGEGTSLRVVRCYDPPSNYRLDPQQDGLVPVDHFAFPIEVYEQNRIHRLRDDVGRQLDMLDEFADLKELKQKRTEVISQLGESADALAPLCEERERLNSEVANLPELQRELGEKEKLMPGEEEQRWAKATEIVTTIESIIEELESSTATIPEAQTAYLLEQKTELQSLFGQKVPEFKPQEVVHSELLSEWSRALEAALETIEIAREKIVSAVQDLRESSLAAQAIWEKKKADREQQVSKQLANVGVESPQEIISRVSTLRSQINSIQNKKQPRLTEVNKQIESKEKERETLVQQLESLDARIHSRRLEKAQELTSALGGQIKVSVKPLGDSAEYSRVLNELCDQIASRDRKIQNREGQLAGIVQAISPLRLARALKDGGLVHQDNGEDTTLCDLCRITENTQSILCRIAGNVKLLNKLETATVSDIPQIVVRRRGESEYADLRTGLSPGEQSAAILTLALETRTRPLILDQPEDELGYSYVVHLIVPKVLEAKFLRQLLVVTHNANIPVLGDADYVVKMENRQRPDSGRMCVVAEAGCFESPSITKALVELEGGEQAFRFRQHRYALPK